MKSKMDRREFVKLIAGTAISGSAAAILPGCSGVTVSTKTKKTKKPNIVFIMADDMGYGDIGCYNPQTKIPTPNTDKLAKQGIRFTDAHSSSAVCTPTRYSVLTGRYCWRTKLKRGVILSYDPLLIDPNRMTVASLLKKNGYTTACIGKWHLGFGNQKPVDYTKPLRPGPLELGFDYFFGIPASLAMRPWCFVENDRVIGELKGPKLTIPYGDGQAVDGWKHENVGPKITEKAVEFIKNHAGINPNKPFYLHLVPSAPHRPCTPPDFAKGKSKAGPRGDMVWEFDWTVGKVLDALDRYNFADNTLVIVTSDNGAIPGTQIGDDNISKDWELYDHKSCGEFRGYKTHIWDGGHRTPFIARWPGNIKPNTVSDEIICLTDILATYAAIIGRKLPRNAGQDSYNILPALLGEKIDKPIREATIHHGMKGMFAIRQGPWKLILGVGSDGQNDRIHLGPQSKPLPDCDPQGQLYNLENDPQETENLWCKRPDVVKRLTDLLEKYKTQGYSRPL